MRIRVNFQNIARFQLPFYLDEYGNSLYTTLYLGEFGFTARGNGKIYSSTRTNFNPKDLYGWVEEKHAYKVSCKLKDIL